MSFLPSLTSLTCESGIQRLYRPGLNRLKIALTLCSLAVGSSAFALTPTTTSLVVTSNGTPVTTVGAGVPVTLTATVLAGATALKQGQVNFCDATATYCTDIHWLGTAQLDSTGKAILHLAPSPGAYSYKAEFLGTSKTTAASGSTVATLTVTGPIPTATAIDQSGPSGNYILTASVYGFTKSKSLASPTGTISFVDTTTSNSVLATAPLTLGSGPAWLNATNPVAGSSPGSVVTGDFNGDGNLDLAAGVNTAAGGSTVILLGDGTGNFNPVTTNPITASGGPALVQDFNGDGIPDLLLTDAAHGAMFTVLLGNGDGTFTTAAGSPFPSLYGAFPVVAGDFNGDGIPDFAVAGGYYLTVWLGNGDGTFTEVPIASSYFPADSFFTMVVGDFNSDGIADIASSYLGGQTIAILLGKGDGTFTPGTSISVSPVFAGTSASLAMGDFNGDGKLDLAAPVPIPGGVAVFLGQGDGTFQPAGGSPIPTGEYSTRVLVGDFNGDGVADIFVSAMTSLTDIFILLGNGDGTFSPTSTGTTRLPCCSNAVLGDVNGDGVTDIVAADSYGGTVDVFLTGPQPSTATVNGISVTGPTPQLVVASYPGDTTHAPSQSASAPLLVQAAAPIFTPSAGLVSIAQAITLTSTTPGAGISYQATGALQTNGFVHYFGPILVGNLGTVTIQAYADAYNYGTSLTSSATYTVVTANPVPVLDSLSPAFTTAGGPAFTITINGSAFTTASTAQWGTTALPTQYISTAQLTAHVTAAQIANAGITPITVLTPAPGGGVSNVLQFETDSAGSGTPPAFTTTTATVVAGSTATYPVTLPSTATSVSVSCLNLPSGASCSYSASPAALTVTTASSTPPGTYQITAVFHEVLPGSTTALVLGSFLLIPLAAFRRKRGTLHIWTLALLALVLSSFTLTSCGGGSGGGAGGQTHTATSSGVVTLTVQ